MAGWLAGWRVEQQSTAAKGGPPLLPPLTVGRVVSLKLRHFLALATGQGSSCCPASLLLAIFCIPPRSSAPIIILG